MIDGELPMPPQPTTKEIPAVSAPPNTVDAILTELRAMRGDVTVLVEEAHLTNKRIGIVEQRMDAVERRQDAGSERARAPSSHDLETSAALSAEIGARQALAGKVDALGTKLDAIGTVNAAQTEMLTTLTSAGRKFFSHPTVHTIGLLLGAALIAWLKGRS